MVKCKHRFIEVSKGFKIFCGYSPTILQCSKCSRLFHVFVNKYMDFVRQMRIIESNKFEKLEVNRNGNNKRRVGRII